MEHLLLQDWTTIRGATSATVVTQSEASWLDASRFHNAVFWLDVKELLTAASTPLIAYQTSPTKEEAFFVTMGSGPVPITVGVAAPFIVMRGATPTPLMRWVRWTLQNAGATGVWDITFRLLVGLR